MKKKAIEYLLKKFGWYQDNPAVYMGKEGLNWLKKNQKYALEGSDKTLLRGKITGILGGGSRYGDPSSKLQEDMFIPTKVLKSMKGAAGERRIRGEGQFESLKKQIGDDFDIDQKGNKVVIGVNQKGEGFVLEGNTRTAVADKLNIPYLKTEVRYFNGGELVKGKYNPTEVARMARDRKESQKSLKFEKEYGEYIKENMKDPNKKPYQDIDEIIGEFQFNKGGTTMKNNPPVGSTPEEVADDIPAMISEGEFVIPADVVRYVGLDKIRAMMHEAKMGLQCMEDEGLIVDVDEEGRPEEPQKEPKGEVAILDVVQIEKAEPMTKSLKEGGIVSPILNPEEEVKMNQGGMLTQMLAPDGSLVEFQEGGMVDQMDAMMMEEMPQEVPDIAQEMPEENTDPMADAPMLNAPVAQVINDVPHILAYLQEDEIKALHSAGRGLDAEGKQQLSPEGVPVFYDGAGVGNAPDEPGTGGSGASGPVGGDGKGTDDTGGPVGAGAPDSAPGDSDDDSMKKMQEELTKADKEALDPEADDRKFVKGVGFIEKYIASRNQPNPLQGKPQYAVSTVAGGGLMRTPVYLDEGGMLGGMMDEEDNRRFEGQDEGGSIEFNPQDLSADEQNRLEAEAPSGAFDPEGLQQMGYEVDTTGSVPVVTSSGPPSEPNIASQEEVRERLPDLFNQETGERLGIVYGPEGGYRAEQILGENPDISDASLEYLRRNRDVFLDAKKRTESDEDVSYEDVAQQHFALFGRHEDRKGMDGLMSMQGPSEIDESLRGDPIGSMVGDIAGGIMSPDTPEVEDDVSQIGKPIIAETDPELGSDEFHHVDASRQTEIERKAQRDNKRQYQPGREPTDDKGRPLYAPADTIGDFDRRDVELFARSLGKAKGDREQFNLDITDFFEEKEDGSFDVIPNDYGIGFQKPTKESRKNKTPVKLAGSLNKEGIPVSRALASSIINSQLALIDET